MEQQDIFCIRLAEGKLYHALSPRPDNFTFCFLEEEKCSHFISQLKFYMPDTKVFILPIKTISELKTFALSKLVFVYLNPTIQVLLDNAEDCENTFLIRFNEGSEVESTA